MSDALELFGALFYEIAKTENLENSTNNLIFKTFFFVLFGSITYLRNCSYDFPKAFISVNTIYSRKYYLLHLTQFVSSIELKDMPSALLINQAFMYLCLFYNN